MRKIPGTQDGVEGSVSDLNNISASLEEAEQNEACGCCSDSWLSLAHLSELVSVVSERDGDSRQGDWSVSLAEITVKQQDSVVTGGQLQM